MTDHSVSQWSVTYLLHCFTLAIIVLRYLPENHPSLAADLSQQFGGDTTDRQPWMIHQMLIHQGSEQLCFVEHGINMLWLGEILHLAATRYKADFLAFREFSITSDPASP